MNRYFNPVRGLSSLAIGLTLGSSALLVALEPLQANPAPRAVETIEIAQAGRRLRIAILDFDFSSVSSFSILNELPGISRGTSDIAVNGFVNEGTYSVVERSQIEKILSEQDFGASGRVDAATAAEIGRILGVDAVLVGAVTELNLEENERGTQVFGIGTGKTVVTANVGLNVRLINTTTAEIVAAAEGAGEASQKSKRLRVGVVSRTEATENRGKLVTDATRQAVEQVVSEIALAAPKLGGSTAGQSQASAQAKVAGVDNGVVVLNRGSNSGFQNGTVVAVERVSSEITDPDTGKVLRRISSEVGRLELYEVDNVSSLGRVISGVAPQVGDVVKAVE
ncbi:MAG: CsgG/HfaB family protein [Cyanobacteria bacterium J06641_5]